MKTIKFFTMAAVCAAFVSSCSVTNEKVDFVPDGEDLVAVKFGSKGIAAMQTKVDNDRWEGDEQIGIFMLDHGTTNVVGSNRNVKYINAQSALTAVFTPDNVRLYYPTDGSLVDFISYYPYKTFSGWDYSLSMADQTHQSELDLIAARTVDTHAAGYSKENGATPVEFEFNHLMSKIVINILPGVGMTASDLVGLTVEISDATVGGLVDLRTLAITYTSQQVDVEMKTSADGSLAEAILPPQGYSSPNKLVITTAADDVYIVPSIPTTTPTWEGGNRYTYTVTLSTNEVGISGSVNPWGDIDGGSVPALPQ